ncbi:ArsR/SmtB family transcription factor [Kribbella swartbergensis]
MPTVLAGVSRLDPERIRHVASPLIELGCALHVMAEPRHHDRTDWAAAVPFPAVLREELSQWSWTVRAVRSRFFATSAATGMPTWQDELKALRARTPEDLAAELVRPLRGRPLSSRTTDADAVRHWARSRGRVVAELVEGLLTAPEEPVRRFLALLDECWEHWFREVWEESRDALAARGRHDRDLAMRDGVAVMLRSLDSSIDVRDKDSLLVQKVQNKRIDLAERSLLLVPSNYIAPHLFLGEIPGEPLTIIYPAGGRGAAVPTAQQVRSRLEALAAPDRLQVCRAVASEPRTAGEIAALWGLHPTQVTRHLRALTRAGLVTAERQGRFVAYRLDETAVRNLGTDLLDLVMR